MTESRKVVLRAINKLISVMNALSVNGMSKHRNNQGRYFNAVDAESHLLPFKTALKYHPWQ